MRHPRDDYNEMIPRFRPRDTAWVRSLAPSFARMLLMWVFVVSSLMSRCAEIVLFTHPEATNLRTSSSRVVNAASAVCFAISAATSAWTRFSPPIYDSNGIQYLRTNQAL